MKTPHFPYRALFTVALLSAATLQAQSTSAPTPSPLGLLRLGNEAKPNEATPVPAAKFSVDELSVTGVAGANKSTRNNAEFLALDAGRAWSRPLRGSASDVSFVSFRVCASPSTIIDIAGARLGLTAGPIPGGLQLMFDDSATGVLQWKSLNYHLTTAKYDGRDFAALPTLTVCLDPTAGVWHLYAGSRLIADNLPLIEAKKSDRQISIRAGSEGAWIVGLVLSDENPIYEDANANAIDDVFEKQQRGGVLLLATASKAERQLLARQWKAAQRVKAPPAFFVQVPLPDNLTAKRPPRS